MVVFGVSRVNTPKQVLCVMPEVDIDKSGLRIQILFSLFFHKKHYVVGSHRTQFLSEELLMSTYSIILL